MPSVCHGDARPSASRWARQPLAPAAARPWPRLPLTHRHKAGLMSRAWRNRSSARAADGRTIPPSPTASTVGRAFAPQPNPPPEGPAPTAAPCWHRSSNSAGSAANRYRTSLRPRQSRNRLPTPHPAPPRCLVHRRAVRCASPPRAPGFPAERPPPVRASASSGKTASPERSTRWQGEIWSAAAPAEKYRYRTIPPSLRAMRSSPPRTAGSRWKIWAASQVPSSACERRSC
jgi:hypothetical protein